MLPPTWIPPSGKWRKPWLAAVNTSLGVVLYNHALQSLTADEMNVLLKLSPIWTALMGWWLLNETWKLPYIIGIVVLILGVMLVQKRKSKTC